MKEKYFRVSEFFFSTLIVKTLLISWNRGSQVKGDLRPLKTRYFGNRVQRSFCRGLKPIPTHWSQPPTFHTSPL